VNEAGLGAVADLVVLPTSTPSGARPPGRRRPIGGEAWRSSTVPRLRQAAADEREHSSS
jgi:hypothetical protein